MKIKFNNQSDYVKVEKIKFGSVITLKGKYFMMCEKSSCVVTDINRCIVVDLESGLVSSVDWGTTAMVLQDAYLDTGE